MKLQILELASLEIDDGQEYYNLQQAKLVDGFKKDVQIAIDNIVSYPKLYPQIDDDMIVILSIAHQRRKPYYWIDDGKV